VEEFEVATGDMKLFHFIVKSLYIGLMDTGIALK